MQLLPARSFLLILDEEARALKQAVEPTHKVIMLGVQRGHFLLQRAGALRVRRLAGKQDFIDLAEPRHEACHLGRPAERLVGGMGRIEERLAQGEHLASGQTAKVHILPLPSG